MSTFSYLCDYVKKTINFSGTKDKNNTKETDFKMKISHNYFIIGDS